MPQVISHVVAECTNVCCRKVMFDIKSMCIKHIANKLDQILGQNAKNCGSTMKPAKSVCTKKRLLPVEGLKSASGFWLADFGLMCSLSLKGFFVLQEAKFLLPIATNQQDLLVTCKHFIGCYGLWAYFLPFITCEVWDRFIPLQLSISTVKRISFRNCLAEWEWMKIDMWHIY